MAHVMNVEDGEQALRAAMLAGDVAALSSLVDDALVFTGADGTVLTKAQDLAAHASGLLKLTRLELRDTALHPIGEVVVATCKANLAGTYDGINIDGGYAYTRLWSRASGSWRVVAGHAARLLGA